MLLCKTEARMVISTIILGVGKPKKNHASSTRKTEISAEYPSSFPFSSGGRYTFHQLLNGVSA